MRKLISILGALSLVATSSITVIACSKKDYTAYNDFVELANATRPTFNENGEVDKPGSTLIYYIGGQDNYSSLSFEYALKKEAGGTDKTLQEAFDYLNNSTSNDDQSAENKFKSLAKNANDSGDNGIHEITVKYDKSNDWWKFESKNEKNDIFSSNAVSGDIKISGTSLENILDLWSSASTSKILSQWITPSIARMSYELSSNNNSDSITTEEFNKLSDKNKENLFADVKKEVETKVKEINGSDVAKGPVFLIIKNGEFIGFLEGYKFYSDVLTEDDKADNKFTDIDNYDKTDLFNFFTSWSETLPFQDKHQTNTSILKSIYSEDSTLKFLFNDDDSAKGLKSFIETWDEGATNVDSDSSDSTDSSSDGDTDSTTSSIKTNFIYKTKKY